ncbi:hypothetical protein AVEN_40146-1 [Araneus ventricosus]|uniref:Uncharacterized protein n=1 Tax=Araneus ventricosus TaxID=182803 RepID=A0A4Y2I8B1_ARAVE|nr:hypothetical protein AVEN_40146-1 [Araneus ventricosus]
MSSNRYIHEFSKGTEVHGVLSLKGVSVQRLQTFTTDTDDGRLHLNATYGQQWIGRCGLVLCSARSPDFICLDYFLWGYVMSLVYETPVNSAEDLVACIAAAAGEVRDKPGIFANVRSSMYRRCEACITAR